MKQMFETDENLKIFFPHACGNAPKKILLKELTIALATSKLDFIDEQLSDHIEWNIIGVNKVIGKKMFVKTLQQMGINKVTEIHINHIITHGSTGSINGTFQLENEKGYAFCHVYLFTSAGKNSKIKKITSYLIEI